MLATLIQRYDKKISFIFDPVQKREINIQMPHFMLGLVLYINLLNFSWIKMSIFKERGAFKNTYLYDMLCLNLVYTRVWLNSQVFTS